MRQIGIQIKERKAILYVNVTKVKSISMAAEIVSLENMYADYNFIEAQHDVKILFSEKLNISNVPLVRIIEFSDVLCLLCDR